MPGMDGFEVLKRIKTISPGAVVVMITGHGDRELEKKALDLNATDFIHKPVQKEALDAALEKAEKLLNNGTS
jgi:YesN/AraC family two-component response regulator